MHGNRLGSVRPIALHGQARRLTLGCLGHEARRLTERLGLAQKTQGRGLKKNLLLTKKKTFSRAQTPAYLFLAWQKRFFLRHLVVEKPRNQGLARRTQI